MFRFEPPKPKFSKIRIILPVILALFLVIGILFWTSTKINTPSKISFQKSKNGVNSTQSQIDSDNDGLFDWQEKLFGTDKYNPDTDADGTNDGDEIKQNRDPSKSGPNDKLPDLTIENQIASRNSKSEIPKTLTDKFTLAIAKQILENLPENISPNQVNSDFLEKQIENTLSSDFAIGNILKDFFQISLNNLDEILNIKKDLNYYPIQIINNSEQYFIIYGQIISKYFSVYKNKNIFEIINNAFQINNFSEIKNLAEAYKDTAQEFKKIKPPQQYLEYHIEQIKLMLILAKLLNLISDIENDPITASLAIKTIPKITQDYINLINKLKENVK